MTEITHYSNPQSRGIRTQMLLDVFEIPHKTEVIDFRKGENRSESYLKIHPYGLVPALRDGDLVIVESGAITLYLADRFAEKMGTPATGTPERARLYEWLFFLHATLEPIAMKAFASEDKSECTAKVKELLSAMTTRFVGPYVLGETFTLLDVILATELTWYQMIGLYPEGLTTYDQHIALIKPKLKFPG